MQNKKIFIKCYRFLFTFKTASFLQTKTLNKVVIKNIHFSRHVLTFGELLTNTCFDEQKIIFVLRVYTLK